MKEKNKGVVSNEEQLEEVINGENADIDLKSADEIVDEAYADTMEQTSDDIEQTADNQENHEGEESSDDGFSSEVPAKKKRKRRKDMTPQERKRRRKIDWLITGCVFGTVGLLIAIFALAGFLGFKTNMKMVQGMATVGCDIAVEIDEETGYYTFTTDDDFRVLQLTDVHIGAGAFSIKKDNWALNAVETIIRNEKPNLVIVTGDIAYPVPFQAGTFNNLREAELFATMMEKLGVYWAPCFGNHDTEAYSMYNREEISNFYSQSRWEHCLFQAGPSDVDGYGNYIINVKNTQGLISQSLVMFDSHSYVDGDILGIAWKYDNIHQNQVDWYTAQINALNDANKRVFATLNSEQQAAYVALLDTTVEEFEQSGMIKSSAFFHIPLAEYRDAWTEYVDNGKQDTENVKYNGGVAGETGKIVYSGIGDDQLFETMLELGSTQGIFCGHDHLNNFSLNYKGITLTYGMSIDYLAYMGIVKKTQQRGGTTIDYSVNGEMTITHCRLSDY